MRDERKFPKITFGIIVLNGEPFTRYCLRSLYPFAHEIIVVEGASKFAKNIADTNGHSIDGTLETLYRFKAEEDPEDKIQIITMDGFWSEKDEQSQAYAKLATGDYLWQVDIDEFYRPQDMQSVIQMLRDDTTITAISFKQITFWGGFEYITDGWYLRNGAEIYHRLFKWGQGYNYKTHRPPTIYDDKGRNLRNIKWIDGYGLARKGIFLYHYSLIFPKQVCKKSVYYSQCEIIARKESPDWAERNFLELNNPFRVHNVYDYPSWLMRFEGNHPLAIQQLRNDIQNGLINIELRNNSDVEGLINSPGYKFKRKLLIWGSPLMSLFQVPGIHKIFNLFSKY
jgi:hypothetical protein